MGTDPFRVAPSPWIARFAALVPAGGTVLDLACGGGRHSRLFLERGHPVTAMDRDVAQARLAEGAELIAADLEDGSPWPLAGRSFDAVVVTNYLWRPLFPSIRAALKPGGALLYETFAAGNEAFGRPANPDHLLKRGELLELAEGLTVIAYEDGIEGGAKVVQRICAVNGPGPAALT
ncbi:class I SAM-dependent methyltransferase [Magnetospirillum sp. 15-1]|uniref:class I SAM-dependent methyltransferase n=1 Tax=Magnetospirillum sp. 15-1 TaxID=1979370 RepID=UPI000BBC0D2F|nr:class I SAM-dependent methyltransferase [Magnetospirillum sp. 15-1]